MIGSSERFFNPLHYVLIEDSKTGSSHAQILPLSKGCVEDSHLQFHAIIQKSAGSSKLLATAVPEHLALCPELASGSATVREGRDLFSQNQIGLKVNSEIIWSFIQP